MATRLLVNVSLLHPYLGGPNGTVLEQTTTRSTEGLSRVIEVHYDNPEYAQPPVREPACDIIDCPPDLAGKEWRE